MSDVQGTVAAFDPDTRSGTVVSDSGERIAFTGDAFDGSGLRLLRLGQRVRVQRDTTGVVTSIGIPTIGAWDGG